MNQKLDIYQYIYLHTHTYTCTYVYQNEKNELDIPGTPRPTTLINGCFNWMMFTKSLYRKMQITISIHPIYKMAGLALGCSRYV